MNFEQLQEILQQSKDFVVVAGGNIDRSKPEVSALCDAYFFLFKQKVGVGTCRNCIFDAYFELKQITPQKFNHMTQEKKFKLKRFPLYFGARHQHYTNANITDEIAVEMVNFNRVNAANFENPEELLAAADALKAGSAAPVAKPTAPEKTAAPVGTSTTVAEKTPAGIVEKTKVEKSPAPVAPPAPVKVDEPKKPAAPVQKPSKKNQAKKKK